MRLKHGLFEVADRGTIFLDEIGEVTPQLQVKLLRVLETGIFRRLGGTADIKVDVRIIAATNRSLEAMMKEGGFREDLYYRLNVFSLHIPPLRERRDDIPPLVDHFIRNSAIAPKRMVRVADDTMEVLRRYPWPGNVRELAAEIERLVLYTAEGAYIRPEDISPRVSPAPAQERSADAKGSSAHLENMLEDYERRVITETLRRNDYNVARAAAALGLGSRQTLYKKLKRLAINVGDFLQDEQHPGLQLRADPQLSK